MPETAVHEDNRLLLQQNEIGTARQILILNAVSETAIL